MVDNEAQAKAVKGDNPVAERGAKVKVKVKVKEKAKERANPMAKEKERVKAKVNPMVKTVMLTKKAKIVPNPFPINSKKR